MFESCFCHLSLGSSMGCLPEKVILAVAHLDSINDLVDSRIHSCWLHSRQA